MLKFLLLNFLTSFNIQLLSFSKPVFLGIDNLTEKTFVAYRMKTKTCALKDFTVFPISNPVRQVLKSTQVLYAC